MLYGIISIFIAILSCAVYYVLANYVLDYIIFPARGSKAGRNLNRANIIRPWVFLFPALVMMGTYLIYPLFETVRLSVSAFGPGDHSHFVGAENYEKMFQDRKFWEALYNNILWLCIVPAASTALGAVLAELTQHIGWGNIAKALVFMPVAISFVGAAVIWKFVYEASPVGAPQIGILNAMTQPFGGQPQHWLTIPFWNNFFLMAVMVWMQTGFAMVFLAAALRRIPQETIEAAVMDGASPFQVFFKIKTPQITPTLIVVWTTSTVVVLKIFDIVFAMTNGQWQTQVLANYMYEKLFRTSDWGVGSASAIIIFALMVPILIWNVCHIRKEMR